MGKDYYLGLDIGSGSVGWAVTDATYQVLRAHGKSLWGVRLFDGAKTAEERRIFRTGRRRLDRRNWRVELLQGIFEKEITALDDGFFMRMKESRYWPEDKRDKEGKCPELPYSLFVDKNYTDIEYYKQFPTIYHLRQWLMRTEETPDIRLVYLAFLHMMKHRGHFLLSGNIEQIREFNTTFTQFLDILRSEELDFGLYIGEEQLQIIENVLKDTQMTKSVKKSSLMKCLEAKTPCEKAVLTLLTGGTVKLSDIFGDKSLEETEKPKISFSDASYEDYAGIVAEELGEQYAIIEQAKTVYDWAVLADILGEYEYLSDGKVSVYEKHRADLQYLKKLVKEELGRESYRDLFEKNSDKIANYTAYAGQVKHNGKKQGLNGKRCSREEFYAYLKKNILGKIEDKQKVAYLQEEIEKETFLPKQVTKDNSVIPYQVHLAELNQILKNLKSRIPLLEEHEDKIRQIFTFRIPYYVGPLNGIGSGEKRTNWVQKRTDEKIYPWNFQEVIDIEASAEKFIRRMTNKCTYLYREDVLPKYSLLYSKYMVLNELNNLRLDGELISVELKQRIYEDLFQKNRKVTQKKLKNYLVREGLVGKSVEITGIDGDFKGSLTAYLDFKEKLTGCTLNQEQKERIILDITLFGDDKKLLERRLQTLFPELTEKQRKSLCQLPYQGWGRLSRKFLEGVTAPAPETGEVWSIMRTLWETNDNLMQILSEKYNFADAVEIENGAEERRDISYQMVEELRVSPAVRRQIWQTLLVVKELCKVLGNAPKRVFVEMAREKGENKRTDSRKKRLLELYKKCKEMEPEILDKLNKSEESSLRGDKLYLYFIQKGRCMYSGERIAFESLWDNNLYDIDHIYPQSKVMDDSLDNRVLVKREYNMKKTDVYPIAADIREKMRSYWKMLFDSGLISKTKFERLVRSDGFSPTELAGFIARQLVETRQGTKAVAGILKQVLPETEIVYVKAKTVSKFRQDFDLIKVREMNDYHHAKDAYLNVVVGNVYFVKFTKNAVWYVKEHPGRSYNLQKMFSSEYDIVRGSEVAWKAGGDGSIRIVKNTMQKNNILVTRRNYEVKGGLFDQQLMKKGKGQVPIKGSDERLQNINKYGGYNKETGAYYLLVESEDKKGNKIRTIEYIPLHLKEWLEQGEGHLMQYLEGTKGLKNPKVLLRRIKTDTLFKVDGFLMWLSGRTGNQLIFKCANQLVLSSEDAAILKKVVKYAGRYKENKNAVLTRHDKISGEMLERLYDAFLDKLRNTVYGRRLGAQILTLSEKRERFAELTLEEQCLVLFEILHMFQCQSGSANLKLLGGPASAGILLMNSNITKCNCISIINQSPAGIYEQVIDLKEL